ncbi:PREDICTED: cadherin-like protein 26 [Nanorana parkeri]|uniref:cadherin-like protein 26 n=1 Tax=Nanorana parkeri TaxID=125878 RepID=UPI00085454CD|nr:PREDICTED: cadherin-like protein 26 [Nanorana parkeri]
MKSLPLLLVLLLVVSSQENFLPEQFTVYDLWNVGAMSVGLTLSFLLGNMLSENPHLTQRKVVTAHIQRQQREVQTRRKRHVDPAGSFVPLRRSKRRWVLTTIVLEENDRGPFPKKAGDLFNDRAENYSIKYLISGPGVDEPPEKGLFHVNDLTGEVYVNRAIDREKTPLFTVRFDVANRLDGSILDKSLIFNVEVRDSNDNAPRFSQSVYNLTLKETTRLDSPIFQVIATDDDKEDTPNSQFDYYLIKQIPDLPNVKFTVDSKNGLIRGDGCLNYEASNFIRLIVGAKDKGAGSLFSTTTVNMLIQDGNNNMPVFTSGDKYELSVQEGEVKDGLLRLKVEDKDTPQTPAWRAKYKILLGNEKENYNLTTDPKTNEGILSIVKPLDFEGTPTKTLIITVENEEPYYSCQNSRLRMDKTAMSPNITVSITVIDANDAPVFTPKVKVIREKEGVKVGTVLGTFTATDPDRVPNKIRYKIAEDPAGWMTVDENTGVVTTLQELDRESPFVNGTTYTALVHAIDDGEPPGTGTGTILLYLSDVNDHTPKLVTPFMYRCDHQLDVPFVVEAADRDMDPFAGPFKFDVSDHSQSMSETWQVKQVSDHSAEVVMLKSLTKGNYTIPFDIYDRQGTYKTQDLNVRVCSCPDRLNCEKMAPASYQMGGGAIGAILAALLLFLLALCLLMCFLCGSGKKKHILPNDEGNQTLIMYNEEGGSALSQANPAALMAAGNGTNDYGIKDKEAVGRVISNSLSLSQAQQWEGERDSSGRMKPRAQYQSWEVVSINRVLVLLLHTWWYAGYIIISQHMYDLEFLPPLTPGNAVTPYLYHGRTTLDTSKMVLVLVWGMQLELEPVLGIWHKMELGHSVLSYENELTANGKEMVPAIRLFKYFPNYKRINIPPTHCILVNAPHCCVYYLQSSKYMKNGTFRNRYDNLFVEKIGEILNKRLHGLSDDEQGTYKPRVYAYEGDLDFIASMESINCPDDTMDFSFLNQFDPKFARLEEICKK